MSTSREEEATTWRVREGEKFAVLAVETTSLPAQREGEVALANGSRALFKPPINVPERWKGWLGSLLVERFQRSNLVIVVSERSEMPGVVDSQVDRLERGLMEAFLGVLLHGTPFGFRSGISLSGEHKDGELQVRRAGNIAYVPRINGMKSVRLQDAVLLDASQVAVTLRDRVMAGDFRRLRDGFASWHGAKLERSASERLHGFVRSLDGVMILQRSEGKRMFRRRGQILLTPSTANDELLGELYDLRSATAHLNDFENTLIDYPPEGRNVTAILRSFQAELLATEVYRRVLSSPELLDRMSADASILGLWDLDERELRRLWGPPIDIDSPCREHFVDANTRMFPEARLIRKV